MQKDKVDELVKLLAEVKTEGLMMPNMPFEVMNGIFGIVNLPTVEVIITREGKDFLLVYRKDNTWDGWHIPGGFVLYQESIADACQRIASTELGIDIKLEKVIDAYTWPDHPYGGAVSIVCKCTTTQEPKAGQWFTQIPSPMVPHHANFLTEFLKA